MIACRHLLAFLPFPVIFLMVSPIFGGPVLAAQSTLAGFWATERYASVVEISVCPENTESVCGTIVWLWDAVDGAGLPVTDAENPDPGLRDRPLIGRVILAGTVRGTGKMSEATGEIYNPEDGRTYRTTIRLIDDITLHVKGCVVFICRTQVWRRPESLPRFEMTTVSGRS